MTPIRAHTSFTHLAALSLRHYLWIRGDWKLISVSC